MGLLPNHQNAVIPIEKLTEYCLNEEHPAGKEKARVFKSVLGLTSDNASLLKEIILENLEANPAMERHEDEYGKRYSVKMNVCIFGKDVQLVTGWIILSNLDYPRLTSCYIKV